MNGSMVGNHEEIGTFELGTIVEYTCDVGFILAGSPSIECVVGHSTEESVWNASIPICQGSLYMLYEILDTHTPAWSLGNNLAK